MKKTGLLCAVVAVALICGSVQQPVTKQAVVSSETFEVSMAVNAASGTTTAKSGTTKTSTSTKASTTKTSTSTSSSTKSTTSSSTKTTSGSTTKSSTGSTTKSSTGTTTKTTVTKTKVGEKKWSTKKETKYFYRNGIKIYGELYRPVGDGPFPGIIICHGINGSCNYAKEFAQQLAENGVVAYIFDFIGGGNNGKSGGNTTDMSVLTEAQDLNVCFNGIRSLSYVDETRMFVMGESQGGLVATYVAGTRPKDVKGLIALYPAYSLQNPTTKLLVSFGLIPNAVPFFGATVSRKYFQDLVSFDIYSVMANFTGKAVILHGTADSVTPISYSEKAAQTMKNCKLVKVSGADHGFQCNSITKSEALKLIKEVANK